MIYKNFTKNLVNILLTKNLVKKWKKLLEMEWNGKRVGGGTVGEHTTYIKSKGIFHVMNIFLAQILTELEHF